jgi:hypothetical protein
MIASTDYADSADFAGRNKTGFCSQFARGKPAFLTGGILICGICVICGKLSLE